MKIFSTIFNSEEYSSKVLEHPEDMLPRSSGRLTKTTSTKVYQQYDHYCVNNLY